MKQKALVFGERTLMAEFVLAKDSALPMHGHPYEQTVYDEAFCFVDKYCPLQK